jgi:hypothetical protein
MKKLLVTCAMLLFIATLAFCNPFCGTWELQGSDRRVIVVIEETRFTSYQGGVVIENRSGTYTIQDVTLTTNGVPWLYYFMDVNHFGLVGWMELNGSIQPVLMLWNRIEPERQDG